MRAGRCAWARLRRPAQTFEECVPFPTHGGAGGPLVLQRAPGPDVGEWDLLREAFRALANRV